MLTFTPVKVRLIVILFTLATMLVTLSIGYSAYVTSRDSILSNTYESNLDLARAFRDYSATKSPLADKKDVLGSLRSAWNNMDKSTKGGFLCVVDNSGKLTLHTAAPDREGVDVGQYPIHPTNQQTLQSLVQTRTDYVGPYLSSSGQQQVAAFAYSPLLDSVISVHIPYGEIDKQLGNTTLPWIIGLMAIAGLLLPLSNWFLHYIYARAQEQLTSSNLLLKKEIIEREKGEEQLTLAKTIIDNTPAVISVKDTKGRHTYVNLQFEQQLHVKRENVIGKTLHDIFPGDLANKMQENEDIVLQSGQVTESEIQTLFGGNIRQYMSIKFPLTRATGEIYAVCGVSTDITTYKTQEEQLRHSQKLDALGKLTGGVAHDYNNLLGIIIGYAEELQLSLTDQPELVKFASEIQHAGERGAKLTKKLLTFTKQKRSDSKVVNINQLLCEQRLMLEKTLTARITLEYNLANKLWPVNLDSADFEDAVLNICINAMHAMKEGGRLIIQSSNQCFSGPNMQRKKLPSGDYVSLSIIDAGCGMEKTTVDKMFDPFFSTKGEEGTGLGLSQVYGFVDRSGGEIDVYSEIGKGTQFTLHFPRSYQTIAEESKESTTEAAMVRADAETVLLVDDEKAITELACVMLTAQNYRVLTASNGVQALKILKHEQVDLVITDVIMPHMDGYQLAAEIQQLYPNIKIQIVSGFADDRDNSNVDASLLDSILMKPYKSKTLLTRVRNLLDDNNSNLAADSTITTMGDEDEAQSKDLRSKNVCS